MINKKKAAMFGLDARIALAIFGALSVISGAALYSALLKADAIALLTEMQEEGKAWEQYYLDTRQDLPRHDTSGAYFYVLENKYLIEKPTNIKNWRGPYISGTVESYYIKLGGKYKSRIRNLTTQEIWAKNTGWSAGTCLSGRPCALWISIEGVDTVSYAETIDKIVDGVVDSDSGNFRWYIYTSDGKTLYEYFLNYLAIKNPRD